MALYKNYEAWLKMINKKKASDFARSRRSNLLRTIWETLANVLGPRGIGAGLSPNQIMDNIVEHILYTLRFNENRPEKAKVNSRRRMGEDKMNNHQIYVFLEDIELSITCKIRKHTLPGLRYNKEAQKNRAPKKWALIKRYKQSRSFQRLLAVATAFNVDPYAGTDPIRGYMNYQDHISDMKGLLSKFFSLKADESQKKAVIKKLLLSRISYIEVLLKQAAYILSVMNATTIDAVHVADMSGNVKKIRKETARFEARYFQFHSSIGDSLSDTLQTFTTYLEKGEEDNATKALECLDNACNPIIGGARQKMVYRSLEGTALCYFLQDGCNYPKTPKQRAATADGLFMGGDIVMGKMEWALLEQYYEMWGDILKKDPENLKILKKRYAVVNAQFKAAKQCGKDYAYERIKVALLQYILGKLCRHGDPIRLEGKGNGIKSDTLLFPVKCKDGIVYYVDFYACYLHKKGKGRTVIRTSNDKLSGIEEYADVCRFLNAFTTPGLVRMGVLASAYSGFLGKQTAMGVLIASAITGTMQQKIIDKAEDISEYVGTAFDYIIPPEASQQFLNMLNGNNTLSKETKEKITQSMVRTCKLSTEVLEQLKSIVPKGAVVGDVVKAVHGKTETFLNLLPSKEYSSKVLVGFLNQKDVMKFFYKTLSSAFIPIIVTTIIPLPGVANITENSLKMVWKVAKKKLKDRSSINKESMFVETYKVIEDTVPTHAL